MESFSHKTKLQLLEKREKRPCCEKAELLGLICFAGIVISLPQSEQLGLKIMLETEEVAERICFYLAKICDISPKVALKNHKAVMLFEKQMEIDKLRETLYLCEEDGLLYFRADERLLKGDCCRKAFIRGAFLGGGSVSDPGKSYHLEFATRSYECAESLIAICEHFGLTLKWTTRKSEVVVYAKGSEEIADMLGLIGASAAVMNLYDTMITKDMRNQINRQINCENANMTKTANAAAHQILAIQKIMRLRGLNYLPDSLREMAELRLEYPEANLKELGQMLSRPIGKSGANHRLNRILEIAETLS